MNTEIIKEIAHSLNIKDAQVKATLELFGQDNTIPFIAIEKK